MRLWLKWQVLAQERAGVDVALLPVLIYWPKDSDYFGGKEVAFHPQLAVHRRLGDARLAVNVGLLIREHVEFLGVSVDDQLTYGAGLAYGIARGLEAGLTLTGAVCGRCLRVSAESPAEILDGVAWDRGRSSSPAPASA